LTPDSHGSYVAGTWSSSSIMSMADSREYYASQVLKDGRVLVAGGEYGTGGNNSEVYNPVTNTWSPTGATLGVGFGDAISEILPDGRVLVSPVGWLPLPAFTTVIYNPASNSWAAGPVSAGYQNEVSWVKLPDNSILTIDINSTNAERY